MASVLDCFFVVARTGLDALRENELLLTEVYVVFG